MFATIKVSRAATGLWSASISWLGGSALVLGCLSQAEACAFARNRCYAIGRTPRFIGGAQ